MCKLLNDGAHSVALFSNSSGVMSFDSAVNVTMLTGVDPGAVHRGAATMST